MARKNRFKPEFRPDPRSVSLLKTLRLTHLQRMRLLRWMTYALTLIMAVVLQDVIMSQVRLFGTTTELAVCVILLITVIEGVEVGSVFCLIASTFYFYTGSAPGAYCIGLLTFLGTFASLLRQMYWRRSRGAIVLCAALAQILYSLGLYGMGLFYGLTRLDRLMAFLMGGGLNIVVMFFLYPLIYKIGMIGGNVWKE